MNTLIKIPFYVRLTFSLVSLIAITYIFYMGKSVLIPILLAFLFAVLLLPMVHFLNSKFRFPHVLAVSITVILFVSLIIAILAFISYQISDIASDFAEIRKNINLFTTDIQRYIRTNFHVSIWEQRKYLEDVTQDSVKKGKETIGTTLISVTNTLLDITLIPIYTFLILLYRTHFILFLTKLFRKEHHPKLQEILTQIKGSVQSYISGLIIEMIFVSILTSIGLYIIGVPYFILLGIITGILNLIPYIGILVAGILTILSSLTGTPDLSIILGVIGVNIVVQIIDNNILVPLIINTKVQINAFVSIIGIILGGGIAGIAGMFLAIPILAILKIIFDRIESLEAWGYLMGDNLPKNFIWKNKNPLVPEKPSEMGQVKITVSDDDFTEPITESNTN
ncbi:Predicted PurR-regulated permease PerM [Flavobacterium gillisiae]|uniref:Predicted PurR-regulated permease PerM n=1 Tax=Flavobacterium gillisiae TaxID=150146 RepID=A0A1H4A0B4_9FLAO|nr:AI-2E family transporter [Flavobacterium gillisiae]SEA29583.1 Predicted PurR-regulated permease PerM [Flavobacterium gillisiae]